MQQALLDLGVPQEQRMFKRAGMGTARPRSVAVGVPYPTYCCLLTCNVSMSEAGLRLGTEADRRGGKQKAKGKDKNTSNTTRITSFFPSKPQQEEEEDEDEDDEEEEGVF